MCSVISGCKKYREGNLRLHRKPWQPLQLACMIKSNYLINSIQYTTWSVVSRFNINFDASIALGSYASVGCTFSLSLSLSLSLILSLPISAWPLHTHTHTHIHTHTNHTSQTFTNSLCSYTSLCLHFLQPYNLYIHDMWGTLNLGVWLLISAGVADN